MTAREFLLKDDIENNHNYSGHPTDRYYYSESDMATFAERYHEAKLKENMVKKCTHITTRNPKEHRENKCRFCGKPYQITKDKNN